MIFSCLADHVIREAGTGYYAESEVSLTCDVLTDENLTHEGPHYDACLDLFWEAKS